MNNHDFTCFLNALTRNGLRFYDSTSRQASEASTAMVKDLYYSPHAHNHLEIICATDGNPLICINNRWKTSHAGEVKVFNPGTVHGEHYSNQAEGYQILWITLFPQSMLFHMTTYTPDSGYSESMKRLSLSPPMCSKLWDVLRKKGFAGNIQLQARFHFLLMECLCYILENDMLQKTDAAYYHEKVVEQIIHYINDYYWEDISLEQLAGMVRYSPQHLNMVFKKHQKKTLHNYINELRMNKSKELLNNGNMLVKQVATACGFHDPLYFGRKFKQRFGLSPQQYQDRTN